MLEATDMAFTALPQAGRLPGTLRRPATAFSGHSYSLQLILNVKITIF
jgi:hypothetical protein